MKTIRFTPGIGRKVATPVISYIKQNKNNVKFFVTEDSINFKSAFKQLKDLIGNSQY